MELKIISIKQNKPDSESYILHVWCPDSKEDVKVEKMLRMRKQTQGRGHRVTPDVNAVKCVVHMYEDVTAKLNILYNQHIVMKNKVIAM